MYFKIFQYLLIMNLHTVGKCHGGKSLNIELSEKKTFSNDFQYCDGFLVTNSKIWLRILLLG